mgnify:CR=1 FL=1
MIQPITQTAGQWWNEAVQQPEKIFPGNQTNFHFFEGQLTMHAHLITAQAKQHPECEYFQFIEGDATDDDTLIKAGIERAAGLVLSLGNDRDNLFATISARRFCSRP